MLLLSRPGVVGQVVETPGPKASVAVAVGKVEKVGKVVEMVVVAGAVAKKVEEVMERTKAELVVEVGARGGTAKAGAVGEGAGRRRARRWQREVTTI